MASRGGNGRGPDYGRARPDPSTSVLAVTPRRPGGVWRLLRIALGFLLLFVGVIGLFLPILQGVLMILGGLALLSRDLPWARSLTDRAAAFVRRRSEARKARRAGQGARRRPTPDRA